MRLFRHDLFRRQHVAAIVFLLLAFVAQSFAQQRPNVILISIDGFRADYIDRNPAPALHALAASGARAEAMTPSFPSKTFPNHYTIVTGLYPAHHGIVSNNIYDPTFHATFRLRDREEIAKPRWWGGEPIWVTAEKQGLKAATMFWPGSEVEIKGVRPNFWKPYDENLSYSDRVDQALGWLDLPAEQRPQLITLYFEGVDHAGHNFGPDSKQVVEAVAEADAAIARLVAGLDKRGLRATTDIIVVSDHGMAGLSKDRVVFLDDYVDPNSVQVVDWSPNLAISAKDGDNAALLAKLKKTPHLQVYLEGETPAQWHFRDNPRITPVVGLVDVGWTLDTHAHFEHNAHMMGGDHGFDNQDVQMRATFIAAGPDFKPASRIAIFPNVDVYDLLAHLLKIQPAANDGELKPFLPVLK